MSPAEGKRSGGWKKALRAAAAVAALLALAIVIGAAMGLFSGKRPENLGVHDGRLAPPKRTPNNVSSQADRNTDAQHYVAPLHFTGDPGRAWADLRQVIAQMPRAKAIKLEPNYLYAEFGSKLMGFVDDVEFHLDEKAGVIQVRSASRLGRRDFGVNRARIETIRARLARVRP